MKIQPKFTHVRLFDEDGDWCQADLHVDYIIQSCDCVIAVLDSDQLLKWLDQAVKLAEDPAAREVTDGFATLVFDVAGEQLVVVADTGGEYLSGEFYMFCESEGIEFQTMVDSFDVTDVAVSDIYTGAGEDNHRLLTLLHQIFN